MFSFSSFLITQKQHNICSITNQLIHTPCLQITSIIWFVELKGLPVGQFSKTQTPDYHSVCSQFPEMDRIAQGQKRTSTKIIFFLLENAGLITGFIIILMITMFAGQINLG